MRCPYHGARMLLERARVTLEAFKTHRFFEQREIMHSWRVRAALCLTALLAVTAAIVSVGPARAAVESFLACASTSPCLEWDNSKSGDAIKGVSSNGTALEGRTQFTSAGQKAGKSGVLGADVSKSGSLNSGVIGTSINGTGVTGMTTGSSAV